MKDGLTDRPGVRERVRTFDGCTRRRLIVECGHPGCQNDIRMTSNHKRLPPKIIEKKAKQRGWSANARKGEYKCPEHKNGRSRQ